MNKILKSSFLIILVILMSKVLGFIREFFIVYVFGVSYKTDAFLVASVVPQLLFSTIDLAFAAILIPIIQEIKVKDKEKLPGFVLALSLTTSIVLVMVTIIGLLCNGIIIHLVAAGSTNKVKDLAIVLTEIQMPMIIFQGIIQILIAALRVLDRPIIGNFIGIPYNLLIILGIFFGKNILGIYGVSVFILLGTLLQAVLLIIYCIKLGVFHRFRFQEQKVYLKKVLILGVPTLISTLFAQLQVVTERILSSGLETGSITIIYYVNKLITLIVFIILTLINSVLYPKMAEWVIVDAKESFEKKMGDIIKYTLIILLPVSVFLIINGRGIVYFIFGVGHLDRTSLNTISVGFGYASIGLLGLILKDILLKILFSTQNVRMATRISILSIVINIVMGIILCKIFGIYGIIVATPLAAYLTVLLLIYVSNKRLKIRVSFSFSLVEFLLTLFMGILIYIGHLLINVFIVNIYINVILNGVIFLGLFATSFILSKKSSLNYNLLGFGKN